MLIATALATFWAALGALHAAALLAASCSQNNTPAPSVGHPIYLPAALMAAALITVVINTGAAV